VVVPAEFQASLAATDDVVVEAAALPSAELGQPVGWALANWMVVVM
jgi:hypothetical protein